MFVVAGEALMDVFTGARTPTGIEMDARIGGSPLNVAVGLARLGQPVAFLGGLSTGALGQRLAQSLADEGVSLACVHRSAAPTTLGLVGLDAHGVADYAFYGEGAADRTLPLAALDRLPAATRVVHVGSYTMVAGETARTQRALVERARGRLLVSYDPNLRLNVEPDIAVWRETLAWMLPRIDVLKMSEEDLAALHPGADPDELAARWLAAGVGLVAVTRGGEGARAWRRASARAAMGSGAGIGTGTSTGTGADAAAGTGMSTGMSTGTGMSTSTSTGTGMRVESFDIAPIPVDVIDTVGAGDTFAAALLARLAELDAADPAGLRALGADAIRDVLGFAARAAAITCSRRGADLPRRAELMPARR